VSRRTELLDRAKLVSVLDRLSSALSGGMRRKLGFAMAMVHDPPLLVLDEPSTGIDPVSRVDLWRLVSEAASAGAAVVMSTTYLDEAERAASLLALDGGRTLASGTLTEVLGSFSGAITAIAVPARRTWAWRRGRQYHEYWPAAAEVPLGAVVVTPDLEDVVIALSMLKAHEGESAA
jgi:ABC-2 type transport system ATP-binding protein